MRANGLAACLFTVAACYHFNANDPCEIACTTTCPSGLECTAGQCHAPGDSCGEPVDAPAADPDSDSNPDAADTVCFGSASFVHVCVPAVPTGALLLPNPLDTTPGPEGSSLCRNRSQTTGPDLCVIAADTITVDHPVRVSGSRALVLLAASTITIGSAGDGSATTLDAGSQRGGANPGLGPDADDLACSPGTEPSLGSAGGAGGSFQGVGGAGGDIAGSGGGVAGTQTSTMAYLRGGCPGQAANGDAQSFGHGGGAVWMIAGSEIDVFGEIDVSGAAGAPAMTAPSPGGGGGTGGMLGLEAPVVNIDMLAIVSANGGGGGAGGITGGAIGKDGNDPTKCLMSAGLTDTTGDGNGGTASCNNDNNAKSGGAGDLGDAAGGGGGAAGYIEVYCQLGSDQLGSAELVQPIPNVNTFP